LCVVEKFISKRNLGPDTKVGHWCAQTNWWLVVSFINMKDCYIDALVNRMKRNAVQVSNIDTRINRTLSLQKN